MTTTIESGATTLRAPGVDFEFDEAQLAAVSFLARYSSRTLEAYRHDLRGFFQWAADHGVAVLGASRGHIELSARGWRTAGWRRRRSTVGSGRSVVSTGSRTSTGASARAPPSTSAGHRSTPRTLAAWIAPSSACSSSPRTSTTGPCRARRAARIERAACQRGLCHQRRGPRPRARPSHAADRGQGQQARHRPARATNRPNDRSGRR
jgi:hypothetical protein